MNNQMPAVGIRLYAESKGLNAGMREARREMDETAKTAEKASTRTGKASDESARKVKRGNDETRTSLKATERAYKEHGDAGESAFTRVGASAAKLAGAAGLGVLGKKIYDVGMGFLEFKQNSELAFTTMLGSGDKARTFLADILAFAKETPFAFTDLTDSAQRMMSFGIETEKVIPILRTLGDTALGTGGGVEKMNGIVTAISQISAKGRLQSEEILQLAERGVPALRILANQAGKTAGAFQKDVTKGLIDAEQAIEWLVEGLAEGTTGINGTTAAFGGLMEQVKGSGGITATFDSAKSAFRNTSAELMQSLLPSIITLVNAGANLMGIVKGMAGVFNTLPGPLRDAALALAAIAVAQKLTGRNMSDIIGVTSRMRTRVVSDFRTMESAVAGVRFQMLMAGDSATTMAARKTIAATRARMAMASIAAGARATGAALSSAFGGPVGMAVMGVTAALSAYAEQNAKTKAAVEEFKGTLEETNLAITETTRAAVRAKLSEAEGFFHSSSGKSAFDDAEKLGISLNLVEEASVGSAEALEKYAAIRDRLDKEIRQGPERERESRMRALGHVTDAIEVHAGNIDEAIRIAEQERKASGKSTEATERLGNAYADAARQAVVLTDETGKLTDAGQAVQSAADAAAKAFVANTSAMGLKLNLSTDKDVENSREAVAKATNSVKDAEGSLAKARGAKKPDAETIRRAEQSLADARKAAKEASENLAATEKRNDPVGQYRRQLKEQQKAAERFRDDMIKLAEQGLNGQSLQELLAQGPDGSADTRKALLGDKKLVGETNDFQSTMDGLAGEIENLARVNATRLQYGGQLTADEFTLGLRTALEEGSATSMEELARTLGENPDKIREVGRMLGLAFVEGFTDSNVPVVPYRSKPQTGFPIPGFATGGIYPGYTPGRDIGFIGVSGGEAIMRPEFTRAVGADWVHRMNALARSAGAGGVQKEMNRYLGGFANGGVPAPRSAAPQIIRLTESQTVGYPMSVENVTIHTNDASDLERQLRAKRRHAFTGGRP